MVVQGKTRDGGSDWSDQSLPEVLPHGVPKKTMQRLAPTLAHLNPCMYGRVVVVAVAVVRAVLVMVVVMVMVLMTVSITIA